MQRIRLAVKGWKPLSWLFSMVVVIALGSPGPAQAGKSHLLQKAERHVMLTTIYVPGANPCGGSSWQDRVLAEVAPDGTVSTQEFAVPDRSMLVVTDIDWGINESPNSFTATRVLRFAVYLGGYGADAKVFETGRITGADLAAAGVWLGSASMTAGFRVGPGVPVCPTASSISSSSGAINSVRSLNLRGYLIKSK